MPKLCRTPEMTPNTTVSYEPDAILERYRAITTERRERRAQRSRLSRFAINTAATVGILAAAPASIAETIYHDIQQGKIELAHDQAEVHHIYSYTGDNSRYASHGTFVLTGFGTKDPSETAITLDAHKEVGDVFAVEYSNNSLDIRDLATRIADSAHEQGINHLTLDGYSLGGLIGLHVAAYLHEHMPDITVTNVIMNSTPIERDDLTDRSKSALAPIEWITEKFPDLLYSKKLRKPVELINRYERYTDGYSIDIGELTRQSQDIDAILQNPDKASALLMSLQIQILTRSVEDSLATLATHQNKDKTIPLTNIIYTGSLDNAADEVVKPDTSSQRLSELMKQHDNIYLRLRDHVQHANPAEAREAYARMQRGAIRIVTDRSLEEHDQAALAQASTRDNAAALGRLPTGPN